MPLKLAARLLLAAALLVPPPGFASPAFEAMLRQAEAIRSSDPAQFGRLIGQLNASLGSASPDQLELLEYLKAYQLIYSGRLDLGVVAGEKLFRETKNDEIRFRVGALLVHPFAAKRDFSESLRYLNETLALESKIYDVELLSHGWAAAGGVLIQLGRYDDGLRYAELLRTRSQSPRTRCFGDAMALESQLNLGRLKGRSSEAELIAQRCLDAGEPLFANFARTYGARQMVEDGRRADAAVYLNEHLPGIEASRYPRVIAEANALLAEISLAAGDLELADKHARQVVGLSTQIATSPPLVAAHRVLYETALLRGNTTAALAHHINYAEADKAYMDEVKIRALAYQQVMSETREKDQAIELLNRENELLQVNEQAAALAARNTQLALALLALLLGTLGFWAWRTRRSQQMFRRLAETDALTGISNRHHFSRRAEAALEYCERGGEPAALVMFDLDEFKAINDMHGHAMGDWVLQQVASVGAGTCRKNDLFGRLGGEEFAFLLIGADVAAGLHLARECRERISAIDTGSTGAKFRVTASFGVAASANVGYNFHALLARADEAMYRSKREGRDRISLHTPEIVASNAMV